MTSTPYESETQTEKQNCLRLLLDASNAAEGLSGRALRKLPFQAHAFFGQGKSSLGPVEFAHCLCFAVEKELLDRKNLELTSLGKKK